jgi:hypothetical protein
MTSARAETTRLIDLLRRERHALAEFLVALAEFDLKQRWLELGYPSLFAYLHAELKLSRASAFYRLTAARLIQQHPAVIEPLRDGRLCFTSVVELSKVLTAENSADVLPRFFHLSRREAAQVRAELAPSPIVPRRAVITSVPAASVRAPQEASPCLAPASGAVDSGQPVHPGEPHRESKPLAELLPPAPTPILVVEPKTAALSRIHLTVSRRLLDKLSAARDALSHSHPGASEDEILEVGLDLILKLQAKRRGLVAKPRKPKAPADLDATAPAPKDAAPRSAASTNPSAHPTPARPPPSTSERSRYVRANVRRAVWKRDEGRCQWAVDGGGICGATYQVEVDHIPGWALGAEATIDKLRLLCRVHQDVHARRLYGDALMNDYTRPKGGGWSEPAAEYAPMLAGHTGARPACRTASA